MNRVPKLSQRVGRGSVERLARRVRLAAGVCFAAAVTQGPLEAGDAAAGSASCRECHPAFHQLWATSHHGQSVQPFSPAFAGRTLASSHASITAGRQRYRFEWDAAGGRVVTGSGRRTERFGVDAVLGGRELCYFLSRTGEDRLQVLPMAYDVRRGEWFNPGLSAVRHLAQGRTEALDWRAPEFTFNRSCYGCHVSGVQSTGAATDPVRWSEPGISCETCHGDAREHVAVCRQAGAGSAPADLRIVRVRSLPRDRQDALCGSCHARRETLTAAFEPGGDFFDHFELAALENEDFRPDGREQGEAYTYTAWQANPCARSGQLGCIQCHTASGRYRFPPDNPDAACLPCHATRVADAAAHSHHPSGQPGGRCVDCHLPEHEFARFRRHDHSFRPPAPASTLAFGGSNACNDCHRDHDAVWADRKVREWFPQDYQAPVLQRARWVAAARQGDWRELDAMLLSLKTEATDEVYLVSMLRLLAQCEDPRKLPEVVGCLEHRSAWVRSAAAAACGEGLRPASLGPLLKALRDPSRGVRVQAGLALASVQPEALPDRDREGLTRAWGEVEAALWTRAGDPQGLAELGRYLLRRGDAGRAAAQYEQAVALEPERIEWHISAATAWLDAGDRAQATAHLEHALRLAPTSDLAWFNWILFLERSGRSGDAVEARRRAQHRLTAMAWQAVERRLAQRR